MNIPTSLPVIPAAPGEERYPPAALRLFRSFTRESYLAEFGVQAPPWNPDRLTKTWFDSGAHAKPTGEKVAYNILRRGEDGLFGLQTLFLDATEASTVNLPGIYTYPAYTVAPTRTTRGPLVRINPYYMSLESDARALMAEMGGSGLYDEGDITEDRAVYPADEPRRMWMFLIDGNPVSAGLLMQSRNARGVGSPGHWDPVWSRTLWVPDPDAPTGSSDTRDPVPQPLRNLLSNERIVTDAMGFGAVIERGEEREEPAGFTAADRALLLAIHTRVNFLP